jgi:hypothetical protein
MNHTDKRDKFEVDLAVKDASPKDDFVASNSGWQAQSGSMRKSSWTTDWFPVANLTKSRHSIER